jgi:hypothetical protein
MGWRFKMSKKSKKVEEKAKNRAVQRSEMLSELQQLVGDDEETYEALSATMFLNPKHIEYSLKEAVENAVKAEGVNDKAKAGMWYAVAGGLSMYEGNVKKVVEYYGKAEKIIGKHYKILKNPEKAVAVAQEYYKKFLSG